MGHSTRKISTEEGIKRAQAGNLMSWSTGLPRKIMPKKVVRAELRDDEVVTLFYKGEQRGRGPSDYDDLFQEFDPPSQIGFPLVKGV